MCLTMMQGMHLTVPATVFIVHFRRLLMIEPQAGTDNPLAGQSNGRRNALRTAIVKQGQSFEHKCAQIEDAYRLLPLGPANHTLLETCNTVITMPEMLLYRSEMVRAADTLRSAMFQDSQIRREHKVVSEQLAQPAGPGNQTLWANRMEQLEKELPTSHHKVETAQSTFIEALTRLEQTLDTIRFALPPSFHHLYDDLEWAAQRAKVLTLPPGAPEPLDDPSLTDAQRELLTLQSIRPDDRKKHEKARISELQAEQQENPAPDSLPKPG
jgi:hypothetical protein